MGRQGQKLFRTRIKPLDFQQFTIRVVYGLKAVTFS